MNKVVLALAILAFLILVAAVIYYFIAPKPKSGTTTTADATATPVKVTKTTTSTQISTSRSSLRGSTVSVNGSGVYISQAAGTSGCPAGEGCGYLKQLGDHIVFHVPAHFSYTGTFPSVPIAAGRQTLSGSPVTGTLSIFPFASAPLNPPVSNSYNLLPAIVRLRLDSKPASLVTTNIYALNPNGTFKTSSVTIPGGTSVLYGVLTYWVDSNGVAYVSIVLSVIANNGYEYYGDFGRVIIGATPSNTVGWTIQGNTSDELINAIVNKLQSSASISPNANYLYNVQINSVDNTNGSNALTIATYTVPTLTLT
jgi:hypothetical protein